MRGNSNSSYSYQVLDDAFSVSGGSKPYAKWLMFLALLILFLLTSYGAWLFFWSSIIAIVFAFICTIFLFIIQYKAILLKKDNRHGIKPHVYLMSCLIPMIIIAFFSLHALHGIFSIEEKIEEEMLCKSTHLSEMYSELEDFKNDQISKVSDVYYDCVISDSGYHKLLSQPFDLSVRQNQNLQAKNLDPDSVFKNKVVLKIENTFTQLKKKFDLEESDIDNVIFELEKDYSWVAAVTPLKFYRVKERSLYSLQQEFCNYLSTDSTTTLLICSPTISPEVSESLLQQFDVSKQHLNWIFIGLIVILLSSSILPIMTSEPSRRVGSR